MRLICPNCGAQYEVDDSLIPAGGRDVQCSNCGHGWFQRPAHLDQGLADELGTELPDGPDAPEVWAATPERAVAGDDYDEEDAEAPTAVPLPAGGRPVLDPSIRGILEAEAEREARARRAETPIETQGDLGLDSAPAKGSAVRERMARLRGLDVDDRADSAAAAVAAATAAGSRRDLLPDIEEINSSLRSAEERDADELAEHPPQRPRRGGFRTGFTAIVVVAAVGMAIYLAADTITAAVPAAEPVLDDYVAWVDRTRIWLDGVAQDWIRRITAMVDSIRNGDPAG